MISFKNTSEMSILTIFQHKNTQRRPLENLKKPLNYESDNIQRGFVYRYPFIKRDLVQYILF